jgi:osmotically-inducible protein OsmY
MRGALGFNRIHYRYWRQTVPEKTSALRLGAPVRFQDRWAGRVTAIEISEDWEVYNVSVRRGFIKTVSVRLPLEAATAWDDGFLAFDNSSSNAAFGRELTPVAAPSRPVSAETPVSGGGRFIGALVSPASRRAHGVLIDRAGTEYLLPAEGVTFEGKTMHPGVQPEAMLPYYVAEEIQQRIRHALTHARDISPGEAHYINVEVDGTAARLSGNVRSRNSRGAAQRAVAVALRLPVDTGALVDDIELELDIAKALDRAGMGRALQVHVRSVLGAVVLRGHAPSQAAAEEAARVAARVSGVRTLVNRIEVVAGPGERPTPTTVAG